jgi:biopolymer transport protein ExbD
MRMPTTEEDQVLPNLTPVIDVVFLLLIFFLVATQFQEQEKEMKVRLPEVVLAEPSTSTQYMVVNVTEHGQFVVTQKKYGKEQLEALLREQARINPNKRVQIRADGRAEFKYVAWVMGYCNQAKLQYTLSVVEGTF